MADLSFEKKFRLLSASDFSNLKIDSKIFKKTFLRIYFKKNNLEFSRLGISVSTRVGNAVTRNRFKRILREEFRKSSYKKSGYDILCVVQSYSKNLQQSDVELKVKNSFNDFLSGKKNA